MKHILKCNILLHEFLIQKRFPFLGTHFRKIKRTILYLKKTESNEVRERGGREDEETCLRELNCAFYCVFVYLYNKNAEFNWMIETVILLVHVLHFVTIFP